MPSRKPRTIAITDINEPKDPRINDIADKLTTLINAQTGTNITAEAITLRMIADSA